MPSTTTRSIFSPDSPSDSPPPFGASQSSRYAFARVNTDIEKHGLANNFFLRADRPPAQHQHRPQTLQTRSFHVRHTCPLNSNVDATDTCTAASPYSVGPSPVDSNGTEIEDEPALPAYHGTDDEDEPQSATADTSGSGILSPVSAQDSVCFSNACTVAPEDDAHHSYSCQKLIRLCHKRHGLEILMMRHNQSFMRLRASSNL